MIRSFLFCLVMAPIVLMKNINRTMNDMMDLVEVVQLKDEPEAKGIITWTDIARLVWKS